jgi:hypothetical protein
MNDSPERTRRQKFIENSLLIGVGLLAHMPLCYQLPRWTNGLDPTFVHPTWMEGSAFPLVLHMAAVHPLIWVAVISGAFIRICRNYRWRLER